MTTATKTKKRYGIYSNLGNENCNTDKNIECKKGTCDCNSMTYNDEVANLDKQLDGVVIAIGTVGLWKGRRPAYKILTHNLNSILSIATDHNEFYSDGRNVRSENHHHDGTHKMVFRVAKPERTKEQIVSFLERYANGEELTAQKLAYYTKSIHPYIAEFYGWGNKQG